MSSTKPLVRPNSPAQPQSSMVARLTTDAATALKISDAVAETFEAGGAVSAFEMADGRWSLTIHFGSRLAEAEVRASIASAAGPAAARGLEFAALPPTDWVRKSLEGLAPVEAGRFVVHGAHDRARVRSNRIGVQIEAALAFGTGHHGTTRGCLLALDRIAKRAGARRRPRARASTGREPVLDVGTGTGVLAIAAAKALRHPVLASDIDRRAAAIARDNAGINGAAAYVEVIRTAGVSSRRFRERAPFRLIFANILLEPVKAMATPLARLVAPNGCIVLSGLLAAQARAALASYRARGLVLAGRIPLEGWMTLVLVRRTRGR